MILVDTSIWVDHLRARDTSLSNLLSARRVLVHPFVIGELALGYLEPRDHVLAQFEDMPFATTAKETDVLHLIENEKLFGTGIGYVDAHLLASVRLTPGSSLWTRDKRLQDVARRLGLAASI